MYINITSRVENKKKVGRKNLHIAGTVEAVNNLRKGSNASSNDKTGLGIF